MNFLPKEQVIGLQLFENKLQLAKIAHRKNSCTILQLETVPHFKNEQNCRIASLFPATKTLERIVEIGLVKQKEINATIAFEIEPLIPYPIDDAIYSTLTLEKRAHSTKLAIFATVKSAVAELLEKLTTSHAPPELIVPKACALSQFSSLFFPNTPFQIIIDIDDIETCCLLVHHGKPLLSRALNFGCLLFPNDDTISDTEVSELHLFLRELARILLSFDEHTGDNTLPILFTGKIAELSDARALICSFLQREELANMEIGPHIKIKEGMTEESIRCYASTIGAALSFEQAASSPNFCTGEFTPNHFSKSSKQQLSLYFILMLLLSGAFWFYGKTVLNEQNNLLIEKYSTLLADQTQKIPEDILSLTSEEIDDELFTIEKSLQISGEDIALHPDVPRVSDLLVWLSHHPNIVQTEGKSGIQLENLTYVMVKRPEKGKPKERYQVRVDLEFSATSPTLARELHDALLTPNAFVDPKNELKWSVQRGKYRASFFLKDRTQYPQAIVGGANE